MLPAGHVYNTAGESIVCNSHESTHGVSSRIRNAVAPNGTHNAFFVGGGYAFVLPEPRIGISHVAAVLPADLRGTSYSLYLVQMRMHYERQPLYLLDEWTAYTNGAQVGLETGRPEAYELQQAIEFCGYATALLLAVEKYNPAYSDKTKLQEFVGWQCERVGGLCERAKGMGMGAWSVGCERALKNFQRRFCKEVKVKE